jgi:hypothetical protein
VRRGVVACLSLLTAIAVVACTSSIEIAPDAATQAPPGTRDDGGSEAAPAPIDAGLTEAAADNAAAFTPPPLPIIPNQGGPILQAPEIVTVTWASDSIAANLESFDDWMVASDFWKTLMAEWGVGPGKHIASYRVPTAATLTLTDNDIQATLIGTIQNGLVPAPNGHRIYTVYPPAGTTVTSFGTGCQDFQAYHSSFTTPVPLDAGADAGATALVVYTVTPRCADTQGLSALDFTTWGASHEVMEASSDPDVEHRAWVITMQTDTTPELGENADLCTGNPTRMAGHMVTRNWSNVAAAKGDRPCVPAPPGPMFGAVPEKPSVSVKPGSSVTLSVHLYASGAFGSFQILTYPLAQGLTAKLDRKQGHDGDDATLTVTADATYTEVEGQNLVEIYAVSADYTTRRSLIVHAQ